MDPIHLCAFGRNVSVGYLYDYHTGNIFPSCKIPVPKNCIDIIHTTPDAQLECSFILQHQPFNLKLFTLGINTHLLSNIEQGNPDIQSLWFAKCFNEKSENEGNVAQVDVIFRIAKRTEALKTSFIDEKMNEYQLKTGGSTHLVKQVVYGAEYICSMKKTVDRSCETKESAEVKMYMEVKAYLDLALGSDSAYIKPSAELRTLPNCKIYSSIHTTHAMEMSLGNFCPWLKKRNLNKEYQPWQPIQMTLLFIPQKIESCLYLENLEDLKLEKAKNKSTWDWIVSLTKVLSVDRHLQRIPPFSKHLEQFSSALKNLWKAILANHFYKTDTPYETAAKISTFLKEVTEWLTNRKREIELASTSLLKDNHLAIFDVENIKIQAASNDCPFKRISYFVFRIDYIEDRLMEKINTFIKRSEPAVKLPIFRLFHTIKAEQRRTIMENFRKFAKDARTDFNPDICYFIGVASPSSSYVDGEIQVLETADLRRETIRLDENLQNPFNVEPINGPIEFEDHYENDSMAMNVVRPCTSSSSENVYGIDIGGQSQIDPLGITGQEQFAHEEHPVKIENLEIESKSGVSSIQYGKRNAEEDSSDTNRPPKREKLSYPLEEQVDEVDVFQNLSGSIAEKFANESGGLSCLVHQGHPNVYLLNASDRSSDADLRWFHIGRNRGVQNHKIIILMGATGSGKSTLINGMVNYVLGVQWKDPFRFKCVREDESTSRNQAHSQTSSVTAYTIHHQEGMAVPYSITIIDTPGYGDTRGVARDKEITQKIHRFLTQEESQLDQIHAACFVAASGDSRLTTTQRYILDSVLSIFGKDVKENIRLLVTFADNADPPVVEACRVGNFPLTSPSAGIVYNKFNSSVLYACNEQQGEDDFSFDELFWDMGQENFTKFFNMLGEMDGRDLKSTRQVIHCRDVLEQSLNSIESELEKCLMNIENIEIYQRKMREAGQKTVNITKRFFLGKTETRFNKVPCPALKHGVHNFQRRPQMFKEKTPNLDKKAEFESNNQGEQSTEQLLASSSEKLNVNKAKVISLLEQVGSSVRSLESTALRSNSFSPSDYINLIKSRVAEEQKPGYLTRLETLAELQQFLLGESSGTLTAKTFASPNNCNSQVIDPFSSGESLSNDVITPKSEPQQEKKKIFPHLISSIVSLVTKSNK